MQMKNKTFKGTLEFEKENKEILASWNKGLISKEIAEKLDISRTTISRRLNYLNIPTKERQQRGIDKAGSWTRKEIAINEILKLYFEKKMSCTDIAKELNFNPCGIRQRIIEAGYKLRSGSEAHKLKSNRYWQGKHCPNASSEGHVKAMNEWWNNQENKDKIEQRNKKISLGMKGEDNHFYGKKHSEETRKLIRKNTPKQFGEKNPFYGKTHSEETRKILRKSRATQILPVKDTLIEIKIQNFLKQLKIEFYTHNYMHIEHSYQCDILIHPQPNFMAEKKTIIEVDGDYWHGNPIKFPNPSLMQKEQIEEDACRNEELKVAGFNIIRLWENDIKKMNLEAFKIIINQKVNKFKEILA